MMLRTLCGIAVLCLLVGCQTTGNFTVGVINRTNEPLSVGLVKDGPPAEAYWASPTQIGISAPNLNERKWGTLVPAGQQAIIGPVKGKFDRGVTAFLRIYSGDRTISELLAISPGSPDRIDVPLDNGRTDLVITREGTRLTATPATRSAHTPLTR